MGIGRLDAWTRGTEARMMITRHTLPNTDDVQLNVDPLRRVRGHLSPLF